MERGFIISLNRRSGTTWNSNGRIRFSVSPKLFRKELEGSQTVALVECICVRNDQSS